MEFTELFVGGELSHGEWDGRRPDPARTIQAPASAGDFEAHLRGEVGLGLVPIRKDGTCRFAAIDIDVDTIDHQALYLKVQKRNLPLTVCRSKSGGAHLYLFAPEPGLPANKAVQLLKRWASLLGYPNVEIFPKQLKTSKKNLGNWINLPYFSAERTTRYAVGEGGALTLAEFLATVILYEGQTVDETLDAKLIQIDQMPPCLATLTRDGLPEGARNQGLFNFGVFYRKSDPNGWEDLLTKHNQEFLQPPLPYREVQAIIKSIGNRTYQYRCNEEPICSRCDRSACLKLPFGIGNKPWEGSDQFDELIVSNCRKITTDPPRYVLEVNGHDVELGTEEFIDFAKFHRRIIELLDTVPQRIKQDSWLKVVRELLNKKTDIEAPKNASKKGQIFEKVLDYLGLHERAKVREDVLRGVPFLEKDRVMFRASDLYKYLRSYRIDVENNELFQMLHGMGCEHKTLRLKGKVTAVWSMPARHLNLQEEDFDLPDFGGSAEDRL
jgi:hypothetical protein